MGSNKQEHRGFSAKRSKNKMRMKASSWRLKLNRCRCLVDAELVQKKGWLRNGIVEWGGQWDGMENDRWNGIFLQRRLVFLATVLGGWRDENGRKMEMAMRWWGEKDGFCRKGWKWSGDGVWRKWNRVSAEWTEKWWKTEAENRTSEEWISEEWIECLEWSFFLLL